MEQNGTPRRLTWDETWREVARLQRLRVLNIKARLARGELTRDEARRELETLRQCLERAGPPSAPRAPRCGARTRGGRPCEAPAVMEGGYHRRPRNGRCRLHGGLSTGPRTPEGIARCVEILAKGREARARSLPHDVAPGVRPSP